MSEITVELKKNIITVELNKQLTSAVTSVNGQVGDVTIDLEEGVGLTNYYNKTEIDNFGFLDEITEGDVTQYETALEITESQISDLQNYLLPNSISGFETSAQLNARDVDNRNRDNHTGTQAIDTIETLQSVLDAKLVLADINDTLVSSATDKALSANQGKELKGMIDTINLVLLSDESSLDTIQEIVDFIEQNKESLDNLGISNIAGLQTALNNKADKSTTDSHIENTSNPHGVTKAQVGLGSVDNTSDTNKPISTATQIALDNKANSIHTHSTTDLNATGGTSLSFLRKDNTWQIPINTTYAEITTTEIDVGTSPTLRTITARRLQYALDKAYAKSRTNRVNSTTSYTTLVPDFSLFDVYEASAQASTLTLSLPTNLSTGNKTIVSLILASDQTFTPNSSYIFAEGNDAPATLETGYRYNFIIDRQGSGYYVSWTRYQN